ncbi:MAG: hypothetical protein QOH12_2508 [Solirubrobacteraceae bacterium]|jgi:hypothetical protein|nr:hypothetical protein [Solirubrobacteraceae bacterium]
MALIWRSIFQVDDPTFDPLAIGHITDWLRWKLRDGEVDLPVDGSVLTHSSGCEITGRTARDGDLAVLQARLFERRDEEELRTTITVTSSWAWIDLERWSADAFVESWVPVAPGIVGSFLRATRCRRGPTPLPAAPPTLQAKDAIVLTEELVAVEREVPVVVVSPTREELETDLQPALDRARDLHRRLQGIAPVVVLGQGAVSSFSQAMCEALGDGFDVYGGAIRTYLPGLTENDWPGRHRFVAFSRFRGRPFRITADVVAAAIQRGACAQSPPPDWRETLRPLLEPTGDRDDDIHEEFLRMVERERDQERASRVRAEDTLEAERDAAAGTEQENDHLRRRIAFLEVELRRQGAPAGPTPVEDDPFEPDACAEIPPEVVSRLSLIVFPESQWDTADDLDRHSSASWARRAWRALCAMESYARSKSDGSFDGNLRDYCQHGGADAIPVTMVALRESETTDNDPSFRRLRTLTIDPAVCGESSVYMPAHIKIVPGGSPAPRIYFHDDTSGATGKIHIGYFGDHLDNNAKS